MDNQVVRFQERLEEVGRGNKKVSLKECQQLAGELRDAWLSDPKAVVELVKGYRSAENEFVRIIVIYFFKEVSLRGEEYFGQSLNLFREMADDWSGRVKNYGLVQAFADLWGGFQEPLRKLLVETDINETAALKVILLRSLARFLAKGGKRDKTLPLEQVLLEEVKKIITFDEPYVISSVISLLNDYGSKYPERLAPVLEKWATLENTASHYIVFEVLSKKLGKILPESEVELLKAHMNEVQKALEKVQAPLLLGRNYQVVYIERVVQTLLHWINVFFLPFKYGANPYRGCEHGCLYCNARYTHEYLGKDQASFQNEIIVKVNADKALAQEFATPRWRRVKAKLVNLGSVSDPYQPAEAKYGITRKVLQVFLKFENPVCISTKSSLILRDLELLKELNEKELVNVMITIPTLNEGLLRQLEANTPTPLERLETIRKLKANSIIVGALVIPIFPYLTDDLESIEGLLKKLAEVKADFAIADVLNFKNQVRPRFTYFLQEQYPELCERYEALYSYGRKSEYAEKAYLKSILNPIMQKLLKKYGLHHFERMLKGKFENKD